MKNKSVIVKPLILDNIIVEKSIQQAMHDSYAEYVKYILLNRALPDLRDGLKPVQRKIIYALYKLNLLASTPPKKSARTVGEIIAKYHPHGDTSVYASMVRMSQYWKMNFPLVQMQGNNGSIDGDNPAAMRYTEARLSALASQYVVENICYQGAEVFQPNFDNSEVEPIYLHTFIPLLLVNGQTGIASGYATEIPPHNLKEVLTALVYLIKHNRASLATILKIIKGPDFPTGGQFLETSQLEEGYRTGKGKLIVCSKFNIESTAYRKIIVITAIPYGVQKGVLVRQLEIIRIKSTTKEIVNVRDESAGKQVRIVIELKKNVNLPDIVDYFIRKTHFQINYSFNIVVIHKNRPQQLGLIELLRFHIEQSCYVLKNRTQFLLDKWTKRSKVIRCLMIIVVNITVVMKLILKAPNRQEAERALTNKFGFSAENAEQVLQLQLYRLTAFDVNKLKSELKELVIKIKNYQKIIKNKTNLLNAVTDKYLEIIKFLGTDAQRKTKSNVKSFCEWDNKRGENEQLNEVFEMRYIVVTTFANIYQSRQPLDQIRIIRIARKLRKNEKIIALNVCVSKKNPAYFLFAGGSIIIDNLKKIRLFNVWTHLNNYFMFDLDNNNLVSVLGEKWITQHTHLLFLTKRGEIKLSPLASFSILPRNTVTRLIRLKQQDVITYIEFISDLQEQKHLFIVKVTGKCLLLLLANITQTSIRSGTTKAIMTTKNDYIVATTLVSNPTAVVDLVTKSGELVKTTPSQFLLKTRPASGHRYQSRHAPELVAVFNPTSEFVAYSLHVGKNVLIISQKLFLVEFRRAAQILANGKTLQMTIIRDFSE